MVKKTRRPRQFKKAFIAFFIVLTFSVIFLTFSIDREADFFNAKDSYLEYTIMFTENTNYHYLIEHFIFLEEIYPDIWRVTERRS